MNVEPDLYDYCDGLPGIPLREGWGMTETTPMAIMTRAGGEMLGSTGQLIPSTEVSFTCV